MILEFDTKENEKQKEACRAWNDLNIFEVYYGGAKGGGKSFLGVNLIFGDAFTYPGTHYFIARKELTDLTKHTLPSIYEVFDSWEITKEYYNYNGSSNVFELHNGSKVYLLYAKYLPGDPLYERFGSMQMTRGWIEEGGEFEEDAYINLKISIGRWKNQQYNLAPKLLTTLNPKKNYIYRKVYRPHRDNALPTDIKYIPALIYDNKTLSKSYIKNLEDTLKGAARKRLLHGDWEYTDDNNFLLESYDKILDIFTINYLKSGQKYIICDAARFGSDRAITGVFDEMKLIDYKTSEISKTTEISQQIKDFQRLYKVPNSRTLVDSDGVGGGVVDDVGCVGFVNNARAIKFEDDTQIKDTPNYDNIKSQCAFLLADKINAGEIAVQEGLLPRKEEEMIIEELEQLNKQDEDRQLRLISKKDIKKNIGRSPDWMDVFIMRMYFEIGVLGDLYKENSLQRFKLSNIPKDSETIGIVLTPKLGNINYICLIFARVEGKYCLTDVTYRAGTIEEIKNILIQPTLQNTLKYLKVETNQHGKHFYRELKTELRNTSIRGDFTYSNKETRIVMNVIWVLQNCRFRGDYESGGEYDNFMESLYKYKSLLKSQEDTGPDALAGFAVFATKVYG